MQLQVKKLTSTAKLPLRAHRTDAGLDIFSDEDLMIRVGETVAIHTGLSLAIDPGFFGRLVCRSGISLKTPLRVIEGTIDADYRGEVKVICELKPWERKVGQETFYSTPHKVCKGDRIAQLIIQQVPPVDMIEVDDLDPSDRGTNGFGSTGI